MVKTKTEQAIIDALEAVAPQHDVDTVSYTHLTLPTILRV